MAGIMHMLLSGASSIVTDAYFNLVTLLLPGNGTNGAQNNTFLDSSTNNFTITRNGNTTQGTFSPFSQPNGWWSNYFDGASALNNSTATIAIGTNSFTIEGWIYPTSSGSSQGIFGLGSSTATGSIQVIFNRVGVGLKVGINVTNGTLFNQTGTLPLNSWAHFAFVRNGTTIYLYINGSLDSSASFSDNISNNTGIAIGRNFYNLNQEYFTGYISNFRVVNGTAVYTSSFTPLTAPLTAITNTALLTCQSNRFVDNSTNAFTLSIANGSPSVQAFSPFAPTAAYSAATNGGSGYFDGSGDGIVNTTASNSMGTANFTVDFWVYPTSTGATQGIAGVGRYASGATGSLHIYYNVSGNGKIQATFVNGTALNSTASVSINTWTHVAIVRNSGTLAIYINGAASGTAASSDNNTVAGFSVGQPYADVSQEYFAGYVSNFRTVLGTAVYTSAFTPPTAPTTAITNTWLLTNFTNAGIIDNAAKNDLETVGNAQISTTQSKFGGSSMYFDGTGDYLVAPPSSSFVFGISSFTVEAWINISSYPTGSGSNLYYCIFDNQVLNGLGSRFNSFSWVILPSGLMNIYSANNFVGTSSSTVPLNQWVHLAIVRNGSSSTTYYINGTSSGTVSLGTDLTTGGCVISTLADSPTVGYLQGYVNDLRITKGYARYTSNFTVPSAAFPLS